MVTVEHRPLRIPISQKGVEREVWFQEVEFLQYLPQGGGYDSDRVHEEAKRQAVVFLPTCCFRTQISLMETPRTLVSRSWYGEGMELVRSKWGI